MLKQSRSVLCKIFFEDINNFCLYNPFRLSKGLVFLFSKYYNFSKFSFTRKSKIFYKRILYTKTKFRFKKYFKKIRLFKKRLLIFFGFKTFKTLAYLFNTIYLNKTRFLFYHLLTFLELRSDFIIYRLRIVFSLLDSRKFIKKFGIKINNVLIFNYQQSVKVGDFISFTNRFYIYIKFYRFWFNEFIYSNKLLNFNFFNKILLLKKLKFRFKKNLKKIKKKLNGLKLNFFNFNSLKVSFFDKKKIIFKKLKLFNLKIVKFFKKQQEDLLFNFNIVKFLNFFSYLIFVHYIIILYENNMIYEQFILKDFKRLINLPETSKRSKNFSFFFFKSASVMLRLNFFKLNLDFCKKIRINSLSRLNSNKGLSSHVITISSKKKLTKFINLLKSYSNFVYNKSSFYSSFRFESHFKLRALLKSFQDSHKSFYFKIKPYLLKGSKTLKFRAFKFFNLKSKKRFNLFYLFQFTYNAVNRILKFRYIKKNKLRFFSFYKRVNARFKFKFIHNRDKFKKIDRIGRLRIFFSMVKYLFFSENFFHLKFISLFKHLTVFFKSNKNFLQLTKNYVFKQRFFKFFSLINRIDFYNYIFRLKRTNFIHPRFFFFKSLKRFKPTFGSFKYFLLNVLTTTKTIKNEFLYLKKKKKLLYVNFKFYKKLMSLVLKDYKDNRFRFYNKFMKKPYPMTNLNISYLKNQVLKTAYMPLFFKKKRFFKKKNKLFFNKAGSMAFKKTNFNLNKAILKYK
jgi:ribosomal protein S4